MIPEAFTTMPIRDIATVHPGEHLLEFLNELEIDADCAVADLRIPANLLDAVLAGTRGISADMPLRLGRYFGTTPAFWMSLQNKYDLEQASDALGSEMNRIARVA
ncbi:HigA family addiction module antitoxin [Thiocapsa marina]|uniref:Putative plasmid maintenance system antidote protein, XRE family n=1 Tax=Thiocapsa marina 5811 TaxID=768671 RepID=F9U9A2_9GAMM|nr:HigA family addiction module antitoxin [Thiocapsa marina]EGV19360.1 putative plasmid maintenance system antidote protein, XRE family [Thiocapsa marina 5811]